jgi:hypothetical protein
MWNLKRHPPACHLILILAIRLRPDVISDDRQRVPMMPTGVKPHSLATDPRFRVRQQRQEFPCSNYQSIALAGFYGCMAAIVPMHYSVITVIEIESNDMLSLGL